MDISSYKTVNVTRDGNITTLTLNNPEALNAISGEGERELCRFFHEVANDDATDVIVLTGAGRAFSAGGDVAYMKYMMENPGDFSSHTAKQMTFALLDCPKPIIAKVNGHAIGLGATLALFCDTVFAASHAKFGDPHVKMGFAAGDGGAIIWPLLIGHLRAKEYLMTGDTLTAVEAERIGLINHCVPAEELDARVDEYARRLASGATKAIGWTKVIANIDLKQKVHALYDASIIYERLSNYTEDHREAVTAFIEKRPPRFTGK
jgi:enoyl-CoA hydratase